jgi:hypothetical protein
MIDCWGLSFWWIAIEKMGCKVIDAMASSVAQLGIVFAASQETMDGIGLSYGPGLGPGQEATTVVVLPSNGDIYEMLFLGESFCHCVFHERASADLPMFRAPQGVDLVETLRQLGRECALAGHGLNGHWAAVSHAYHVGWLEGRGI